MNLSKNFTDQKLIFWLVAFCILITIFRISWLYASSLPLYGDEAQYWVWAQDLNFGYYSKPPVIAWLIWFSTALFGDSEASIRITSPIIHLITSYFVYLTTLRFFKTNTAFWCTFAYITLPAVFLSSVLASTDAAFMMFWAISLHFYIRANDHNKLQDWILLGVFSGLGLLTKYTMGVFCFSVIAHIVLTKKYDLLKNKYFWASAGIAGIIFLPNLVWNYLNNFPSLSHTYDLAQGRENEKFSIKNGFEFIFGQLAIVGPVFFPAIIYAVKAKKIDLLKAFTFTFLILITAISFYSRAHANWAAPAYISGIILAIYVVANSKYKNLVKISVFAHSFICILAMMYLIFDDLKEVKTPLSRIYAIHEIAEKYKEDIIQDNHKILVFDDRMILSIFRYYLRDQDIKFIKWNPNKNVKDHFDLTTNMNDFKREDMIVISSWLTDNILDEYSKKVVLMDTLSSSGDYGKHSKTLNFYYMEDFYGY